MDTTPKLKHEEDGQTFENIERYTMDRWHFLHCLSIPKMFKPIVEQAKEMMLEREDLSNEERELVEQIHADDPIGLIVVEVFEQHELWMVTRTHEGLSEFVRYFNEFRGLTDLQCLMVKGTLHAGLAAISRDVATKQHERDHEIEQRKHSEKDFEELLDKLFNPPK